MSSIIKVSERVILCVALSVSSILATAPAMAQSRPVLLAQSNLTEGEVRKVDGDAQKITIRHGPIEKFDMGAMTMVFRVADPAMLKQVEAGDKVMFDIDRTGGAMTIIKIDKVK